MPCCNQSWNVLGCDISHSMTNSSRTVPGIPFRPTVPDSAIWWMRMFMLGTFCQACSVFGITNNAMNIIVYVRLGLKDPMNVSLLGLSISDFVSCFTMSWYVLCVFPPFTELELPFKSRDVAYLFAGWPHLTFARTTTVITAFITIERCLCVTFPLRVKELITTKRVLFVNVIIYLLNISLVAPIYFVSYYDWKYVPEKNRTIYSLFFRENRQKVVRPVYFLRSVFLPIAAFTLTIISTVLLVYHLERNAKWRQGATGGAGKPSGSSARSQESSRDSRVAKMVVMIAVIYLVTSGPQIFTTIFVALNPDVEVGGPNENVVLVIYDVLHFLTIINASVNSIVYFKMSSKYRAMFVSTFRCFSSTKK